MDLAKSFARLDDAALSEFFSNAALAKARGYLNRVRDIERAGGVLRAKVQGSDYAPYAVTVRLETREFFGAPSLEIATRCTCPVGNRCKHAAALLLAVRKQGLPADKPRSEILQWAAGLKKRIDAVHKAADKPQRARDAIFYVIAVDDLGSGAALHLLKGAADEQGRPKGNCSEWYNVDQALVKPPSFVQESDLDVFRALKRHSRKSGDYGGNDLFGATGAALLEAVFATGRIWTGREDNATVLPLQRAAQRAGRLIWRNAAAGLAPLVMTEPPASVVMPTEPLYYLDVDRGEIGRVEVAHPEVVLDVLRLPPLTENELPLVAAALAEVAPELPATLPGQTGEIEELAAPLEPVLHIDTLTTWGHARHRDYETTYAPTPYDYALAWFRYGDAELLPGRDARHRVAAQRPRGSIEA